MGKGLFSSLLALEVISKQVNLLDCTLTDQHVHGALMSSLCTQESVRFSMMQGLNERGKLGLYFAADMKAVNYIHLAQYFAPNFEPATEEPLQRNNNGK